MPHIPILKKEVVELLDIHPDDIVLDGTVGFGGHSAAMLEKLTGKGMLIGIDQDEKAVEYSRKKLGGIIEKANFADFEKVLAKYGIEKIDKVLLDLGMSSFHLDSSGRGFSFQKVEPLDMRMDQKKSLTAQKILSTYHENELIELFQNYGELRHPEKFVKKLLERKKEMKTTQDLISAIKAGFYFHNSRQVYMKTCAQVFQALRIEVNQELEVLQSFLGKILGSMTPNGKIAIISFHSLEDRIVKNWGKAHQMKSKAIQATQEEIRSNSRAKSAKLRVFQISKPSGISAPLGMTTI